MVNYAVNNWCAECGKAIPKRGDGFRQKCPNCHGTTRWKPHNPSLKVNPQSPSLCYDVNRVGESRVSDIGRVRG